MLYRASNKNYTLYNGPWTKYLNWTSTLSSKCLFFLLEKWLRQLIDYQNKSRQIFPKFAALKSRLPRNYRPPIHPPCQALRGPSWFPSWWRHYPESTAGPQQTCCPCSATPRWSTGKCSRALGPARSTASPTAWPGRSWSPRQPGSPAYRRTREQRGTGLNSPPDGEGKVDNNFNLQLLHIT